MTSKPIWHAIAAASYIILIISGIFAAGPMFEGTEETIFIPMAMLCLLVLSVALMGYLFFGEPVKLLIEGKADEAKSFLLRTLGTFTVITAVMLGILAYVSFA